MPFAVPIHFHLKADAHVWMYGKREHVGNRDISFDS